MHAVDYVCKLSPWVTCLSYDCSVLLGYDDDFSTFQERFESFLLELEKQRKTKVEEVSLYLALFPGAEEGEKEYTLFAHVPNRHRIPWRPCSYLYICILVTS